MNGAQQASGFERLKMGTSQHRIRAFHGWSWKRIEKVGCKQ
jgi:hypothetical protein